MSHTSHTSRSIFVLLVSTSFVTVGSTSASASDAGDELWSAVLRDGTVRVIARLAARGPDVSRRPTVAARRGHVASARARLVRRLGGTRFQVRRTFEILPAVALEVDAEALASLEASGDVIGITEDRLHAPAVLDGTGGIRARSAWADGVDGSGQVVVVLDTGVDSTHPFLEGAVVHEACFSETGDCPDGGRAQFGSGAAAPCAFSPHACAHGTHVAGIAAGRGPQMSGVAPGAAIIAVQVFSRSSECRSDETTPCPRTRTSDYLRGLEYVHELRDRYPIAAVNLSFAAGTYGSTRECDERNAAVKDMIDDLRAVGIATVAAAGNDHRPSALGSPACISSAVSVGAVEPSLEIAGFSNHAPFLSLVAPGRSITSSIPGGGFAAKSGTSMAAPHVTGAWALLHQVDPWASVNLVLTALSVHGPQIPDPDTAPFVPLVDVRSAIDFLSGACACLDGAESFCDYPPDVCPMTVPGGPCDPNGDGDRSDADWERGWHEFQAACRAPVPVVSPGRAAAAPWAHPPRRDSEARGGPRAFADRPGEVPR